MSGCPRDDVMARGRRTVVRRKRMSDVSDEYVWRSDEELARYDASNPMRVPFADYERNWSFDMRFTDTAGGPFAVGGEGGGDLGDNMDYNHHSARAGGG